MNADDSEDENVSIRSLELNSKITLDNDTNDLLEYDEWNPAEIARNDTSETIATSTQYINTIAKGENTNSKIKMDNKRRVLPRNYLQATTGDLADTWQPAIEKEMRAIVEHYVWLGHRQKA